MWRRIVKYHWRPKPRKYKSRAEHEYMLKTDIMINGLAKRNQPLESIEEYGYQGLLLTGERIPMKRKFTEE